MDYLKGDERRGLLRTGIVVASLALYSLGGINPGEQTFPQNGAILSVMLIQIGLNGIHLATNLTSRKSSQEESLHVPGLPWR